MLPEVDSYLNNLESLRNEVAEIINQTAFEGLNWRPGLPRGADPTNSLAVLAVHVAGAEHFWIAESIGKFPPTRNRDAEFAFIATSRDEPLARLVTVAEETRGVLARLTPADLDASFMKDDHAVPVRWSILHVLHHYSLHIGHMQLTFQLWNKGRASESPRWFNRLPKASSG